MKLPFVLGAEDKLAFRLDQFNLGAPVKWYRELTNMRGVTREKIKKLSNGTLNDNVLPEDIEDACYNLAMYDIESLHPEDQKEQKLLYMRMFERTKSYDEGRRDVLRISESPAFKHPVLTHKVMQFLQDVHRSVDANSGEWKMWEKPDKNARLAKDCRRKNIPKEETTGVKEEPELEVEVDISQFAKSKKLDQSLQEVMRQEQADSQEYAG